MVRAILALGLITACCTFGQAATASLSGDLRDPTGGPVAGGVVTVRNTSTNQGRSVFSNASGRYSVPSLTPGTYELTAEAPGFKRQKQRGIILQVGQDASLTVQLELGSVNETVQVTAEPTQTAIESSSTGTVIENRKVVELPLNSREFYGLALLAPGTFQPAQNSTLGFRGGFNVAGATETSNNFTVNGIDNNDTGINGPSFRPSVEAIQEFKLLTGSYSAEYGRNSGGQVIVITKSGTNEFHGTLFEFVRNQMFDASNYFTPGGVNPAYKRNQFGGVIGGPIKRDKTFFFYSYEGLRLRQQISALTTVPLPEMVNGDFRSLLSLARPVHVLNPFTGAEFAVANVVDASLINPLGRQLASFYPSPTSPTAAGSAPAGNYNFSETRRETMNQNSLKIDHVFSARDTFSANYNRFNDPSFEPSNSLCGSSVLPGFGCNSGLTTQLGVLSETHIFSPTLLNEVRAGVNRLVQPRVQEDVDADFPGLSDVFFDSIPNNTGLPSTSVTGYARLGGATNLPSMRADTTYQFIDNLTWTLGRHTIKLGGEYRRFMSSNNQSSGGRGSLSFTASASQLSSGYALADLLLGLPTSTSRNPYQPFFYNRVNNWAWFAQDDFKVNSRLTLNLGLRWEYNGPLTEKYDRMSSFDAVSGTIRVMGQNGVGDALYKPDYNNFAPRIGFAYQPLGDAKTVVRAAYGIFYNQATTLNGMYTLALNAPFRNPQTFNASRSSPISLSAPFPAANAGSSSTAYGVNQDFPVAYRQQWNFGVQRQLTENILIDVGYFGAGGTHLPTSVNLNQPRPGPGTTAQVNARRPFPSFGNITFYQENGNSSFHSLQAKLEKRLSHGLSSLISYTFSKSIDDAPGTASGSSASSGTPQDSLNRHAERGLSDFDVRHRLVWSNVYDLPFRTEKNRLLNGIIQGWEITNILSVQTGRPFTPSISANVSNTFNNSDRPNVVGDPNSGEGIHTPNRWFNTSAFVIPAAGTFGNAGRNIITGPGLVNLDVNLIRNFQLSERSRLQFRAEAFNVANHPNFNYPNAVTDNPSFGIVSSANDPRQIQLALKLYF